MTPAMAIFGGASVAASLLGGLLPLTSVLSHTRLQLYLSFAAGAMLGAVFFHMLPEAVEAGSTSIFPWVAAGLLALFFLERFFAYHRHEPIPAHGHDHDHGHGHDHGPARPPFGWGAAAFGLAAHSLAGGVALASAVAADFATRGGLGPTSWGVFVATVAHKPADALTIISLMLGGGARRPAAHLVNLAFALMTPLGMLLFRVGIGGLAPEVSRQIAAEALGFSAGTFLCIALTDVLPELQFHAHDRVKLSLALLAGFALMAATGSWAAEHDHGADRGPAGAAHPPAPPRDGARPGESTDPANFR